MKNNTLVKPKIDLLVGVIISILLLPLLSATYLPHKQNTNYDLVISSNNATQCNLTYIKYPDSTKRTFNYILTKIGTDFNYTISSSNFSLLGSTCMGITCTDGVNLETGTDCREVTYTGDIITSEQSDVYIVALIFLVFLMIGIYFIKEQLPNSDAIDQEGTIVQVSQLKHLRPVLWSCIWILGIAVMFIIANLGIAYLTNSMIGNLFFVIYRILFYITMIALPINFCYIFYKVFKDNETKKLIERGVEIKSL